MGAQLTVLTCCLDVGGQGRAGGVSVQQRQEGLHGYDQEGGDHVLREVVEGGQLMFAQPAAALGQQTLFVTTRRCW